MEKFKERWEITKNWQLLFPLLGIAGLLYSAYRIVLAFTQDLHYGIALALTAILYFVLLKICLFFFKKLENKWIVDQKWEMIRIFIVFAITGSSTAFISQPLMTFAGFTKENLNPTIYWVLFLIIGLVFYQVLLVAFGWLFGQFKFFWEFEKKMLKRMGLKRFIKD